MSAYTNKAEWKVETVMAKCNCDRQTAVEYLDAEEWNSYEAIISFKNDQAHKQNKA